MKALFESEKELKVEEYYQTEAYKVLVNNQVAFSEELIKEDNRKDLFDTIGKIKTYQRVMEKETDTEEINNLGNRIRIELNFLEKELITGRFNQS